MFGVFRTVDVNLLTAEVSPVKMGKACFNTLVSSSSSSAGGFSSSSVSRKPSTAVHASSTYTSDNSFWRSDIPLEKQLTQIYISRGIGGKATALPHVEIGHGAGGMGSFGHGGGRGGGDGNRRGGGGRGGDGWGHSSGGDHDADGSADWWLAYSASDGVHQSVSSPKAVIWQLLCFAGMLQTLHFLLFTNYTCESLCWSAAGGEDVEDDDDIDCDDYELSMLADSYASAARQLPVSLIQSAIVMNQH